MLFCINTLHSGFFGGVIAFFLFWYVSEWRLRTINHWANVFGSLPGAVGMYCLAVGVAHVGNTLPDPVYALLSGLSAAVVGTIALAAVRLAGRAITDQLTRFLVYLGGALGSLYTALWYYPVLMVSAGLITLVWDTRTLHRIWSMFCALIRKLTGRSVAATKGSDVEQGATTNSTRSTLDGLHKPLPPLPERSLSSPSEETSFHRPWPAAPPPSPEICAKTEAKHEAFSSMSWQLGLSIIGMFLAVFALTVALHAASVNTSRSFSLFSSLYLAGTIIFGGGPVVIPLLKEYIVTPGWVSPRDFLLGLAVIQAFPGPNFNFAVYLGALATAGTSLPSSLGALIAFVAMYTPGLLIVTGFMGLWSLLNNKAWFQSLLRGINAGAVGLVFTAVYRLWQIGCFTATAQSGSPLGTSPWLVAIAGTAYVGGAWFRLSPPVAILLGGVLGVAKWAVFDR